MNGKIRDETGGQPRRPSHSPVETLAASALCLALLACAAPAPRPAPSSTALPGTWAGRPIGSAPPPNPSLKRAIVYRAIGEWERFGRQQVVFQGSEESIPHVGAWEDDDYAHSRRVNDYWRAVDKPRIHGTDCQKPWSAAFISWIMQTSGIPESQFARTPAHWIYLAGMIEAASLPGRYFVPRRIGDYSPEPGDLICAYRHPSRVVTFDGYTSAAMLRGVAAHCDLVVAKNARTLEAIGGNVRNSVSRSTLELDAQGRLQRVPRRPWFLVLQNRL